MARSRARPGPACSERRGKASMQRAPLGLCEDDRVLDQGAGDAAPSEFVIDQQTADGEHAFARPGERGQTAVQALIVELWHALGGAQLEPTHAPGLRAARRRLAAPRCAVRRGFRRTPRGSARARGTVDRARRSCHRRSASTDNDRACSCARTTPAARSCARPAAAARSSCNSEPELTR